LKAFEIPQRQAKGDAAVLVTCFACRNRQSRAVIHPSPARQLALPGLWAGGRVPAAPTPPSAPCSSQAGGRGAGNADCLDWKGLLSDARAGL